MQISSSRLPKSKAAAVAILGFCLVAFVIFDEPPYYGPTNYLGEGRRWLREGYHEATDEKGDISTGGGKLPGIYSWKAGIYSWAETKLVPMVEGVMYSWAYKGLVPLSVLPESEQETAVYWHIPKSGGSNVKNFYQGCLRKRITILSRKDDFIQAKESGLVPSGEADLLFALPNHAAEELFDGEHRGRVMAMFRHPVDRLISNFYFSQIASWQNPKSYHPEWKDLSPLDWAKKEESGFNSVNNLYVRRLADKRSRDILTASDLELAKHTIESYFVVGLMNEMEESIRRFNVVLGIDDENNARCMEEYFPGEKSNEKKTNSNPHPKVQKDDAAYQLLAEQNSLDIQLYEFIEKLFVQQKELIESYKLDNSSDGALDQVPAPKEATAAINDGLELPPAKDSTEDNDDALTNVLQLYKQVQVLVGQQKESR